MAIMLEQESGRFGIDSKGFVQYGMNSEKTSKFDSDAYYPRDSTLWNELEGSFPRSVPTVYKKNDFSKTLFEAYSMSEFKKGINEYMGSREYVRLDDVVIVRTETFERLLHLQKIVNMEIENLVEETALERSNDPLKYDLSTVMEKLEFDEDDLREIQRLVEDGDF